jgi:hypothetical protein
MDSFDQTLAHFGVKGMKWGSRKKGPTDVKVRPVLGNRIVLTSGGRRHRLSEDATRAATLGARAKRSNVRSLSNRELQDLVARMNLEQQYSSLNKSKKKADAARVENLINIAKVGGELIKNVASK